MMLDAFKKLVESGAISEDVQSVIEDAWTKKIQENRDQVTAELREEFAQRYAHDKNVIVEAVNKMVGERLVAEMAELAEDRKSLIEAREAYRRKMTEDTNKLQNFMVSSLSKELVEFRNDRERVAENFAKVEKFVINALAKEIHEFAQDKRDLAETKVKLVREAKEKFNDIKKQFITKSAALVKEAVTQTLTKEMRQLKEDIDSARQVDFGRRLFEAFAQEYSNSYLNEKSETAKLLKVIEKKDLAIAEAKQALTQKQNLLENKEREIRVQRDLVERKNVMSELLAPLGAEQRGIMQQLLESVKTDKLHVAFDKYLPAVMEGNTKKVKVSEKKEALTESTEITGDRKAKPEVGLDNILEIRKLAGLSK